MDTFSTPRPKQSHLAQVEVTLACLLKDGTWIEEEASIDVDERHFADAFTPLEQEEEELFARQHIEPAAIDLVTRHDLPADPDQILGWTMLNYRILD